jgi:serine/threonine-protein phosphatase PGAM5
MPQHIITLIRHGQYILAGEDSPLTPLGREQARITGEAFKNHVVDTIHFSTLRRASETAEIIAGRLSNVILLGHDNLWEGIPTIPPKFSKVFEAQAHQNPDFDPANIHKVQVRLDEAYAQIFRPAEDWDVHDLVVGHGNVLRYLICRALDVDVHAWVNLHPLFHCSLTQIIIAPNIVKEALDAGITLTTLATYNETGHLPPELQTSS